MERRRQQSEMSWAINQRVSANDWCSRLGFSRIAAADEDAKCHSARTQHSLRSSARVTKQNWLRPPPSSRMETIIMARQEEIPTANLHKNIIRPWNKKKEFHLLLRVSHHLHPFAANGKLWEISQLFTSAATKRWKWSRLLIGSLAHQLQPGPPFRINKSRVEDGKENKRYEKMDARFGHKFSVKRSCKIMSRWASNGVKFHDVSIWFH